MKVFFYVIVAVASVAACSFGIHWIATRSYDHRAGWALIIFGTVFFLASVVGWVSDTEYRIRKLEDEVRRLTTKTWDTPAKPSQKD